MATNINSCASENLQKVIQYSQHPNSLNYNASISSLDSGWISTAPMPFHANAAATSPPGYADPLRQGFEWNPLRDQQVNGADCFRERDYWRKKMSDPRRAWHARESLARNNVATNRMRLGPNTRVVECGDPGSCLPAAPEPDHSSAHALAHARSRK